MQSGNIRNICITGHKGFVGTAVKKELEKNHNVFGFDLPENDFTMERDIEDFIDLYKIDTIVHIGAVAGLKHCMEFPDEAVKANIYGTALLLECAKKFNLKFLHTSTWAVNGHLKHPYDITKNIAENLVGMYQSVYNVDTMILRLATMYGPKMRPNGVIWAFLQKSLKGEEITIQGSGNQFRQFLYVDDAAKAYAKALENWKSGRTFEIQYPKTISIKDIAKTVYPDMKKVKFVNARKGDESSFYVSPYEAEQELDWKAEITFKEGIEKLKNEIS